MKVFVISGEMRRAELRRTEGREIKIDSGGERRRAAKRDEERFTGHNNDKMTRG